MRLSQCGCPHHCSFGAPLSILKLAPLAILDTCFVSPSPSRSLPTTFHEVSGSYPKMAFQIQDRMRNSLNATKHFLTRPCDKSDIGASDHSGDIHIISRRAQHSLGAQLALPMLAVDSFGEPLTFALTQPRFPGLHAQLERKVHQSSG